MQIITTKAELRQALSAARSTGHTIGLVPTMGFLHEGHLCLVQAARSDNDLVVTSIFVNPTQFGPHEDFDAYPRDLDRDTALLEQAGVDIVFAPSAEEMYPTPQLAFVQVEGPMTEVLCGASRPTHFRGVTTVVTKLFNLVQPTRAYFGQKDAQQAVVLQRMVTDLDIPVEMVTCPIVREADGLALSSRNKYLTDETRQQALVLNRSLVWAREQIEAGERDAGHLVEGMRRMIGQEPDTVIDYVSVVDADTLQPVQRLTGRLLVALAVQVGGPRLIDNMIVEVN